MKKVEIRKFTHAEVDSPKETFGFLKIPLEHTLVRAEGESLEVSDGYHTFDELYDHRVELYIALCRKIAIEDHVEEEMRRFKEGFSYVSGDNTRIWKSKLHSDGSSYEGWFVMGINSAIGSQISYHIPINRWDDTGFAEERERAWPFDGHTANDVVERLKTI